MIAAILLLTLAGGAQAQVPPAASTSTISASTATTEAPITILEIAFTTEISSRVPVTRSNSFDEGSGEVYFWNRIRAKKLPTRIRHIWYRNDKKVADYDLNIRFERSRVWTGKTVRAGNWRVEIIDETGEMVMMATFPVHKLRDAPISEDPWRQ